MKAAWSVIFLIYFLSTNVEIGSALKCLSCTATRGASTACETDGKNPTIPSVVCTTGHNNCVILELAGTITRSCGVNRVCDIYQDTTGFRKCTVCQNDLCNYR